MCRVRRPLSSTGLHVLVTAWREPTCRGPQNRAARHRSDRVRPAFVGIVAKRPTHARRLLSPARLARETSAKEVALSAARSPASVEPVKALIAEDEATLADELREVLSALWPELSVCAVAANGFDALQAMEQHAPNVVFLDIQMPGMTGLEVAKRASGKSHVVFVTAYDNYAVAAFEQGAVDYVMKPIDAARLADTVGRLKARIGSIPANLEFLLQALSEKLADARRYIRWITASQGSELRLVTVEEICYFQADNKYTRVVTADSESLIVRTIKDLADALDPSILLADPSRHDRQHPSRLRHFARLPGSASVATQAAAGDPAGECAVRAALHADVAAMSAPGRPKRELAPKHEVRRVSQ